MNIPLARSNWKLHDLAFGILTSDFSSTMKIDRPPDPLTLFHSGQTNTRSFKHERGRTMNDENGFFRSFVSSWTVEMKNVKIVHERWTIEFVFVFEKCVHERTWTSSFIFRSSFERGSLELVVRIKKCFFLFFHVFPNSMDNSDYPPILWCTISTRNILSFLRMYIFRQFFCITFMMWTNDERTNETCTNGR